MSRIGKQPISIPDKVQVNIADNALTVEGPQGELSFDIHPEITVKTEENTVLVTRPSDSKYHRSLHGMTRAILANMVTGVSEGFSKALEIQGVGYTVEKKSDTRVILNLGYSHPIVFEAPDGIILDVPDNTHITVKGIDKQLVGQVTAKVRSFRPPEPYKGKGIRYVGEYVRRKAGKAIAAK